MGGINNWMSPKLKDMCTSQFRILMERAILIRLFQILDFSWNCQKKTLRALSYLLWVVAAKEIILPLIVQWKTREKWGESHRKNFIDKKCYDYRLHTGGYSVMKKDDDRYDFQIVHHFIDLNELTLKKIPVCFIRYCFKSNYLIYTYLMYLI